MTGFRNKGEFRKIKDGKMIHVILCRENMKK